MAHSPVPAFAARSTASDATGAYILHGQSALDRGDFAAAEASFASAAAWAPRSIDVLRGLGFARFQLNQLSGALDALQLAIEVAPNDLPVRQVFGRLCLRLREPEEAMKHFRRILKKRPTNESARAGLADAHVALGQLADAQKLVTQMLGIDRRSRIAWLTRARICEWTLEHEEERLCFDELAKLAPHDKSLAYQRSLTLLRLGEFSEGWAAYENRVFVGVTARPQATSPAWDGAPVEHLLIVAEQGFGDVLQFLRFVSLCRPNAQKITLACHDSLQSLLARSSGVDVVGLEPHLWPQHDAHALLMSLPHILRLGESTIAAQAPYLKPDGARVEAWRARLRADGRRNIAVVHASASPHPTEENPYTRRTCPLEHMSLLNELPETQLIDLKVGRLHPSLPGWLDLGAEVKSFDDSAALLQSVDAVVAVDTSIVHVAGALGIPVFMALPYSANWRWMRADHDCPWYDSVKMYRQHAAGDWSVPLRRIADDLAALGRRT